MKVSGSRRRLIATFYCSSISFNGASHLRFGPDDEICVTRVKDILLEIKSPGIAEKLFYRKISDGFLCK